MRGGQSADNGEESQTGVGGGGAGAMDQPETAGDFQLGDSDLDQFAAGEFGLNGEAGDERDAVAAGDEALDSFEAGELDGHIEGGLMASEGFDDALAQRRGDGVGDEGLRAEFADGDLLLFGQGMFGVDDEGDRVGVDGDGVEAGVLGTEGEDAELDGAFEKLVGNLAGKRALDRYTDVGVIATEGVEHREEPEAGVFVGGEREAAALKGAELFEGGDGFGAETQQPFRVAAQELA